MINKKFSKENLFPDGHELKPRESIEVVEKHGFIGRIEMENELSNDTTLSELQLIESTIRTAIMNYAIEMGHYQPRPRKFKEKIISVLYQVTSGTETKVETYKMLSIEEIILSEKHKNIVNKGWSLIEHYPRKEESKFD